MYLLLCGCGVGFSVQHHHLRSFLRSINDCKRSLQITVPDSIEGWADAFGVLLSSYFVGGVSTFLCLMAVKFIWLPVKSTKGSLISGGFMSLARMVCVKLLSNAKHSWRVVEGLQRSYPSQAHQKRDFVMHMSDAVLSGVFVACHLACLVRLIRKCLTQRLGIGISLIREKRDVVTIPWCLFVMKLSEEWLRLWRALSKSGTTAFYHTRVLL